jgi:DNA-binding NtrC family response regulator
MNQGTILWAGPESLLPVELWSELQQAGYRVTVAADEQTALGLLRKGYPQLLVTVAAAGDNGCALHFLEHLRAERPDLPVVVVAFDPGPDEAVQAMKLGARDYLCATFPPRELVARFTATLTSDGNGDRYSGPERSCRASRSVRFIGQDPAILRVLAVVRKVASSNATVLIEGESGTGKELVARQIHSWSGRQGMPFVAVNCAALPEHLLESELFGHEKGAFTGAVTRKVGKFELAHRGTLLLDEISEMNPSLQAKLLRVLQEGEVDRVGGRQAVSIEARVLATTNRTLERMVTEGTFRQDLFYRLNVVRLVLPRLRERPADILPLARYFLDKSCTMNGLTPKRLNPGAEVALLNHHWPGNVRELENAIERAVLLVEDSTIEAEDLFLEGQDQCGTRSVEVRDGLNLRQMERRMIYAALDQHGGNRTHAAEVLGISVRTLRNKLNEYRRESAG